MMCKSLHQKMNIENQMCFGGNVQKSLQIQKPDSTKERKNIIKSLGNVKNAKHILNVIGLLNSLEV